MVVLPFICYLIECFLPLIKCENYLASKLYIYSNVHQSNCRLLDHNMTTKEAYQYFVLRAQEIAISKGWTPVNWYVCICIILNYSNTSKSILLLDFPVFRHIVTR